MGNQLPPESRHPGHHWIERTAKDVAKTRNLTIEIKGWEDATKWPGTKPGVIYTTLQDRHVLVFEARGQRHSIEFDRGLVEDCAEEYYDKAPQGKALAIIKARLDEI